MPKPPMGGDRSEVETSTLRVIDIFDSLQGEGWWTGLPMTFVRLSGCNAPTVGLSCVRWCDTPEAMDPGAGQEMKARDIVAGVRLPRLCLTGGEPLLQLDGVGELVVAAHRRGIHVHLETNGTVDPAGATDQAATANRADVARSADGVDLPASFDWVTVSPKPPAYEVAAGWSGHVDELKLVVDELLDAATAERLAAAHPRAVVSIQPKHGVCPGVPDHKEAGAPAASGWAAAVGESSVEWAMALVMGHPDWRLSVQIHKLLGIR